MSGKFRDGWPDKFAAVFHQAEANLICKKPQSPTVLRTRFVPDAARFTEKTIINALLGVSLALSLRGWLLRCRGSDKEMECCQ